RRWKHNLATPRDFVTDRSDVVFVFLKQADRPGQGIPAERIPELTSTHDLDDAGLVIVHLHIHRSPEREADVLEPVDHDALGPHGLRYRRETRVLEITGDEAPVVEVDLVLLLGTPLAVVKHHGGDGNSLAHAGHDLAHAHSPGAIAGVRDRGTMRRR